MKPVPLSQPRSVSGAPSAQVARPARRAASAATSWYSELINGVEWNFGYVTFLYYFFVVVTYYLPAADVAIALTLFSLLLRPQDWRMSPFHWIFTAFTAWCVLSYLASEHRDAAWVQTYALLKLWLIAFAAFNVIRTRAQLRFFLAFAVGAFTLFPVRGAFVNFFGGYNLLGRALWNFAYANPNDLAAYALLFAAIAAAFFFISRNRFLRLGSLGALALMLLLIFFTQSRGALVAAAIAGMIFFFANRHNPKVLFAAAGLVFVAALLAPEGSFERVAGLRNASFSSGFQGVDKVRSAEQRYQLLQVSKTVAKDNLLFGVGPGVYPIVHGSYARAAKSELPLAGGNRDPHNTIMRTLAETGTLGLVLFLSMILSVWRRAFVLQRARGRAADPVIRFLSLGLVAYMIAGMFGSFTYINILYIVLALIEVSLVLARQASEPPRQAVPVMRRGRRLPLALRPAIQPGR